MSADAPAAGRGSLFAALPPPAGGEIFQTLFANPGCRVERIVSHGHASSTTHSSPCWSYQSSGAAVLCFDGGDDVKLKAGDWITIPAHCRHRVESSSADALWLAVHCAAGASK